MRFVLSLVSVVETLALPSLLMQIVNSTLAWGFFNTWSPDSVPELFSNINLNSPRYSTLKLFPHYVRICGNQYFCQARAIKYIIPDWFRVQRRTYMLNFEVVSFKRFRREKFHSKDSDSSRGFYWIRRMNQCIFIVDAKWNLLFLRTRGMHENRIADWSRKKQNPFKYIEITNSAWIWISRQIWSYMQKTLQCVKQWPRGKLLDE